MQARHTQPPQITPAGRTVAPAGTRAPKAASAKKETPAQQGKGNKPTEFKLNMPHAKSVAIAGSFNNWDAMKTPMQLDSNAWKVSIPLPPGRHEYRFVVDGQWISDPEAKENVQNGYGSENSVITI